MPDKGAGRVSDMALLTHIKAIHAETKGAYYDCVIKLVENAKAMAISEAWLSILPCRLMPAARSGSRRI